ncbi:MAG: hypothetical protein WC856_16760 [Methylococcaceae bacterium]
MLTASGMCVSLVADVVLSVRFVSLVRVCHSRNRLQRSARNATLDTGGLVRPFPSGTLTLKEATSFACHTHDCFNCFRAERFSRVGLSPTGKAPPYHGTRQLQTVIS